MIKGTAILGLIGFILATVGVLSLCSAPQVNEKFDLPPEVAKVVYGPGDIIESIDNGLGIYEAEDIVEEVEGVVESEDPPPPMDYDKVGRQITAWLYSWLPIYEPERQMASKSENLLDIRNPILIGYPWPGNHAKVWSDQIVGFHGYDSHFKFENQMWSALGQPQNQWWPYWGTK